MKQYHHERTHCITAKSAIKDHCVVILAESTLRNLLAFVKYIISIIDHLATKTT